MTHPAVTFIAPKNLLTLCTRSVLSFSDRDYIAAVETIIFHLRPQKTERRKEGSWTDKTEIDPSNTRHNDVIMMWSCLVS